jgi:YD repeat-containing protein
MGKADQDYHEEKDVEEDVTDQTQIKLDYSARSLIFNLQTDAENVSKIELRKEYGYTYTYGPKSNRLMSKVKDNGLEKIEYAYDENGNLTSKVVTKGRTVDTWGYAYDLLNQLKQDLIKGVGLD